MSIGFLLIRMVHSLCTAIEIFIIVWVLLSWVPINPYSRFVRTVNDIADGLFGWLERRLPTILTSPLNFTPLIVLLGLSVLENILTRIIAMIFLGGGL